FDVELLDKQILFVDLGAAIRAGADAVLTEVTSRVESHQPDFVAIDSFRSIGELHRTSDTARSFVYELATQMAGWGATTLLVGEYGREEFTAVPEFAVADGIIRLGSESQELTSVRAIEVMKLRGASYLSGRHFFDLRASGVVVYPRVSAPEGDGPTAAHARRDATGIAGLDELLGGGLPKASATVVQGPTGTGKTLLALSFAMEGLRRNENAVLFTLEETP